MLIRLFPESLETPTILFSLAPPSPTSNIPLPSYYNSQLETLVSYGLPPPRSVYALDKAGWALALLEEVVFDLGVGKVGVKWVDGGVEEWEMEREAEGKRSALRKMLVDVVKGVKESEQRREDEKREELMVNLLQSLPASANVIPPQALAVIHRPSSRVLRRQARSNLLDAFRIHVVHHLACHQRHRSSYPLWIARRCLQALVADYGPVHDLDDDEESLGTDETFEDSMDMDVDETHTPNTSVTSIVPCDDPESMDALSSSSDSEPASPTCDAEFDCEDYQDQDPGQFADADGGGFDPESDKENASPSSQNAALNNPYPSLPPSATAAAYASRTRLPLSESDFEVTGDPSQPNVPPLIPVQLPPPTAPQPRYTPQSQATFIKTVHLHTLISHLEYEEDRARMYLDPETNPDNHRFRSGAAGARGRRPSSLRNSFTAEELIADSDPAVEAEEDGVAEDEEGECEIEAISVTDELHGAFQVESIVCLNPPVEPIFSYESESDDDSEYGGDTDDADGEGAQYLSTPPTSEDESVVALRQDQLVTRKKSFCIKRKPSPNPDSESGQVSALQHSQVEDMNRPFFSTVPLPPDVEYDEEQGGVPKLVNVEDEDDGQKMDMNDQGIIPAPISEPFFPLGLILTPAAMEEPVAPYAPVEADPQAFMEQEDLITFPTSHTEEAADNGHQHVLVDNSDGEASEVDDEQVDHVEETEDGITTELAAQATDMDMTIVEEAPSQFYVDIVRPLAPKSSEGEEVEEAPSTAATDSELDTDKQEGVEVEERPTDASDSPNEPVVPTQRPGALHFTLPGGETIIYVDQNALNDDDDLDDQHESHKQDTPSEVIDVKMNDIHSNHTEIMEASQMQQNRVDDLDGSPAELQLIPGTIADGEALQSAGTLKKPAGDVGDVEDPPSPAPPPEVGQPAVEQGCEISKYCETDECSPEMPDPSLEDDSDGEEEMLDIDLDAPEASEVAPDENSPSSSSPAQTRPSTPAPFISPRSLGASAPAIQCDFEWGKHSRLARAVVLKNWNNPIDSDEMY